MTNERLARRIQAEYLEMPGLCLTIKQAQRLWSLEPRTCEALLNRLIDSRFLRRTDRGLFVLHRDITPRRRTKSPCGGRRGWRSIRRMRSGAEVRESPLDATQAQRAPPAAESASVHRCR